MLFKMKKTGVDFGTKKHGSAFLFYHTLSKRGKARRGGDAGSSVFCTRGTIFV